MTKFTANLTIGAVIAHENISELVRAEKSAIAQRQSLADGFGEMTRALAMAIEKRDPYTAGHQQAVATLSVAIARSMGLSENQAYGVRLGGSIHDVGKVATPSAILNRTGKLSVGEMMVVRDHCETGYQIIQGIRFPAIWNISEIVHQHHERYDGSGYPNGLVGDAIALGARIVAVADTFDAITSHRPYRPGRSREIALSEIMKGRGTAFDKNVVDAAMTFFGNVDAEWFVQQEQIVAGPIPFESTLECL